MKLLPLRVAGTRWLSAACRRRRHVALLRERAAAMWWRRFARRVCWGESQLQKAGILLGIISKSDEQRIKQALESANLSHLFNGPVIGNVHDFFGFGSSGALAG